MEASARIWLFHRLKPPLQGSKTLHLVYSDRLLAGIGATLVVGIVMLLAVALPMIDSAQERSLSDPNTSAAEVVAEVNNAYNSSVTITGFVSFGVGLAVFLWIRHLVNERADAAEAAAYSASKQSKEQLEKD